MTNKIEIDDYVNVCLSDGSDYPKEVNDFLKCNIGKLICITYGNVYVIEFDDDIPKLDMCTYDFQLDEIIAYGKTINDIKMILETKKYNL